MTITRDGFSPNQRVFGQELKFPSLTEEDIKPSFAEALDADSEYARAHRMRITARLALIRMDVQEKVKRAILRKPGGANDGPYVPGGVLLEPQEGFKEVRPRWSMARTGYDLSS